MKKEARAAAAARYKEWHDVGYDAHGQLEKQAEREDIQAGPGIVDIVDTARKWGW